jgi:phosphoribosyl-ATP pyrophosphohydrolase/phosphoribosyl-AMP cyclohydrolase
VKQKDVACHTGSYSCFGDQDFTLQELFEVVHERLQNPSPGSYTAKLTGQRLKEKLMEEAREVIEAQSRDDIIWEAADVLYFLTVLLARNNIEFGEVLHELRRRRKQ